MSEPHSDAECLALIQRGGESRREGLGDLFRRYAPRFERYFRRHGMQRVEAQDLVQDVFVSIVRTCESFRGDADVSVWLWKIARNRLFDRWRADGARPALVPVDNPGCDVPDAAADPDPLEDCVRTALTRFAAARPECANTLHLAAIEGWSMKELAVVLDRNPGATREFVSQCRKALRPFIEPCLDYLRP